MSSFEICGSERKKSPSLASVLALGISTACAIVEEDDKKEICKDNGGDWKKGSCQFEYDGEDEDNADRYDDDLAAKWQSNEEKAEREDDYEDSKRFDATLAFADEDDRQGATKDKDDYSEIEEWNEKDYEESKQDDDNKDNERYEFKSKQGDAEVTHSFKDKDDAEEAYEDLDRDELPHSDKSFNDWEYDDEEHPALR